MCIRVTWRGILLKHKDPGSVSLGLGPTVCLSVKFPVMSMLMLLVTLGGQLLYAKENYSSFLSVERHWERILFIPCPLFFFFGQFMGYICLEPFTYTHLFPSKTELYLVVLNTENSPKE